MCLVVAAGSEDPGGEHAGPANFRATETTFRSRVVTRQALPADGEHWLQVVIGRAPHVNPRKGYEITLVDKKSLQSGPYNTILP